MNTFKFSVGQRVRVLPLMAGARARPDVFLVMRRLPSDTHQLTYRVKHETNGEERVVDEAEIHSVAG